MASYLSKVLWSKINIAILMLISLLIVGVIGFKIMTDLSWTDAFYMTVITVSTVGFGEVEPLDADAKIFTTFLILTNVVVVSYAIKIITEFIITRQDADEIKQKKMQKKIDSLKNHIIICGYGRNGKQAATKLMAYNKQFVVIEQDKEIVDRFQNESTLFVHGNANEDEVLKQAGIEKARCLISAKKARE